MSDFSKELQNFQRYGSYTYKFDSMGNLTFNSSSSDFSQVFLAFPLQNIVYNNAKIETFYNPDFEEFVPTTTSSLAETTASINTLQQQLDIVRQENTTLKSQLDSIIAQNQTSGSAADQLAVRQVILELRKTLGQGRVDSDFSTTFPYTPILKPTM